MRICYAKQYKNNNQISGHQFYPSAHSGRTNVNFFILEELFIFYFIFMFVSVFCHNLFYQLQAMFNRIKEILVILRVLDRYIILEPSLS